MPNKSVASQLYAGEFFLEVRLCLTFQILDSKYSVFADKNHEGPPSFAVEMRQHVVLPVANQRAYLEVLRPEFWHHPP